MDPKPVQEFKQIEAKILSWILQAETYNEEELWEEDDRFNKEMITKFSTQLQTRWRNRLWKLNERLIAVTTPKERRAADWPEDIRSTMIERVLGADTFPTDTINKSLDMLRDLLEFWRRVRELRRACE